MAHEPVNDGTCPFCTNEVLEPEVRYTHGDVVRCPACGKPLTVCCSPEDGLHLHSEEDDD